MTNLEMLNWKIKDSGLKRGYIADALGITYKTLSNKLCGRSKLTLNDITALTKILRFDMADLQDIFFADEG